ncbi:MAG: radical SAM protein [Leptospirales bacterium]
MAKYLLIDYYVDEPACFGVPPFVSPYVRYTCGALKNGSSDDVVYCAVDELRLRDFKIESGEYNYLIIIAGSTVPGKYLGGKIGSIAELVRLLQENSAYHGKILIGGPVKNSSPEILDKLRELGAEVVLGDIEEAAFSLANGQTVGQNFTACSTYEKINSYALSGAEIIRQHFRFPFVIAELETYRGCTRKLHCSFCSETFYGKPAFRPISDILHEVKRLYETGCVYFRLGRQADLYAYMASMDDQKNGYPRPNVAVLEELYKGIRSVAPNLKVLHLDNVNPGYLATYPVEAAEITKIIRDNNTELDTAAMGMESVDPAVIKKNFLKASPDEVFSAIEIVNKFGTGQGEFPALSPGINILGGLPGETEKTHEMNYLFLKKVLDSGQMLRRINIRQVRPIVNTQVVSILNKEKNKNYRALKNRFDYFKKKIRKDIDEKMLERVFPKGSVIKGVILEKRVVNGFLGRAIGSYPITCHLWVSDEFMKREVATHDFLGPFVEVSALVVGYKERALYAIALEDNLDRLPENIWKKILPRELAIKVWEKGLLSQAAFLPPFLKPALERTFELPTKGHR